MHGPDECAGNIQQLCVNKHAPFSNWWEFVKCQNFQGRFNIGTPEVALKCAATAGVDWDNGGAGQCAGLDGSGKGEEGVALLHDSVLLGKSLGITYVIAVVVVLCSNRHIHLIIAKAAPCSLVAALSVYTMVLGKTARQVHFKVSSLMSRY